MNKIDKKRLFDECIQEAVTVARKYMPKISPREDIPFSEEFKLACMLYVKLQ